MGVKVRGGCWCPQCERAVAAIKSTHRLRNAAATVAAPVTYGASLAGVRVDDWLCPSCGGPVLKLVSAESATATPSRFLDGIGLLYLLFWIVVFLLIVLAGLLAIGDTIFRLL